MVAPANRGSDILLFVILVLSLVQLGTFAALALDWNAAQLTRCPSLAITITGGTAICASLSGFHAVLIIGLFALVISHRCCDQRSPRTLALTAIATTGASAVLAGAGIMSLEIVGRPEGVDDSCRANVPFYHSLIILIFSFVINAVFFFMSLRRWRIRRKEEIGGKH